MFNIFATGITVANAYSIIRKVSGTAFGDFWNNNSSAFEAAPSLANKKIALTGDGVETFVGQTAQLETYSGKISVDLFDDSNDNLLGGDFANIILGLEVVVASQKDILDSQAVILAAIDTIGGVTGLSSIQVDETRTWFLPSTVETRIAPQIVTLFPGDLVTLSMDFSSRLNPETSVASVKSVLDDLSLLTIADIATDSERKRAHFNITSGLLTGNDHDLTVEIVTSDGNELTGKGKLQVI